MTKQTPLKTQRRRRIGSLSVNRMLPNMLTLLALCAGLTSIRYGLNEEWQRGVIALILAMFLDGIDGRVARMLRGTSKFGAELDSLSDAISFGVAPAIMIYLWVMQGAGGIGWALTLIFAVCCVLRLARFNTMLGEPELPPWAHNYFTGVPAPAGAGLCIMPMVLSFYLDAGIFNSPFVVGLFLIVVSFLMVSRVPTYSGKRLRIKPQFVLPVMVLTGLTTAFIVTNPWATISALGVAYMASIPFSMVSFARLKKRTEGDVTEANGTGGADDDDDDDAATEADNGDELAAGKGRR